jgi:hypothetical protein
MTSQLKITSWRILLRCSNERIFFYKMNTSKKLDNDVFTYYCALFQTFRIKWNQNLHVLCKFVRIIIFPMQSNHMFFTYFFQNIIMIGPFLILFFVLSSTLTYIFFFNIWKIWIEEHYSIRDWKKVEYSICPKFWCDLWQIL